MSQNQNETNQNNTDLESVSGIVTYLRYRDKGVSIGKMKSDHSNADAWGLVTFKFFGDVSIGDSVTLSGVWVRHQKFGLQFEARQGKHHIPEDQEGIAKYIALSGKFSGFGAVRAELFVRKCFELLKDTNSVYCGLTFSIMVSRCDAVEIQRIARVSLVDAQNFKEQWLLNAELNVVASQLAAFDLTESQIRKVLEHYGVAGLGIVTASPYDMIGKIPGVGFKSADAIALKIGIKKSDHNRVKAALRFVTSHCLDDGHCWISRDALRTEALHMLAMDELNAYQIVERCLDDLVSDSVDRKKDEDNFLIEDEQCRVSHVKPFRYENEIVEKFERLAKKKNSHFYQEGGNDANGNAVDPMRDLSIFAQMSEGLNEQQSAGLSFAMDLQAFVFSGGAGSGKTFVIRRVVEAYQRAGFTKIKLAAPTGKAAERMTEVVGIEAQTIHRLIGWVGDMFTVALIDADLVVIDETSMIDLFLFRELIYRIDFERTSVVFCGDHNQLSPVGPGNVFRDILRRKLLPQVVLTQVVRQAGALRDNALAILNGDVRETTPGEGRKPWVVIRKNAPSDAELMIRKLYDEALPGRMGYDLRDIQLLSPKKEGALGVNELNKVLQALYQKKLHNRIVEQQELFEEEEGSKTKKRRPVFYPGDRVIVTKNDYNKGVMNGNVGLVTTVEPSHMVVNMKGKDYAFDGAEEIRTLDLAYSMTVHRAQGSEWPCVVLVIHSTHQFVLMNGGKNLFYTGATRAKETLVIVGDQPGIKKCAEREATERRRTWLSVLQPKEVGVLVSELL